MNIHRSRHARGKAASSGDMSTSVQPQVMSSEVIREAKQWTAIATVMTRRPSTPRDANRELFGNRRDSSSRPPSAISIGPRHFDPNDPESRPGSAATPNKLPPLSKAPTLPVNAEPVIMKGHNVMPPSVTKRDLSVRNYPGRQFSRKTSAGNSNSPMKAFRPDHHEPEEALVPTPPSRNVHSAGDRSVNSPGSGHRPSLPSSAKDSSKSTVKSHSASGININLAQLYNTGDGDETPSRNQPKSSSSSSSESSSSVGQALQKRSGGSGQGTGEETADQAKYWNRNILPLLEALEDTGQSKDKAYQVCRQLHEALEAGNCMKNMLGRRRSSLLSTLFKQLNSVSTRLQLACARIILALRVRRQNMNAVCKMLFKISREKKLDEEFVQNNLIQSMLEVIASFSNPLDNYETLVYLTGTLKFLSDNKSVSQELADKGCVSSLVTLMINIMSTLKTRKMQKKEKFHATDILIQVTAVLRSMADIDRGSFVGNNTLLHLMDVLEVLYQDETLTLNISRILSKLTMYDDLYPDIFESSVWSPTIWNALVVHKKCANIVIRLFFALGNITAKDDDARIVIHNTKLPTSGENAAYCDPAYLSVTNSILQYYLHDFLSANSDVKTTETREHISKCLDTVNKIVRVIANLSISEELGELIASDNHCIGNILEVLRQIKVSDSEELIINTLTTLNNLSYYSTKENAVTENRVKVAKLLMNILVADSMPCVMEAARVFGNISRYDDIRTVIHENQVDSMMVALLDSGTWQMVYSACGVLINITANDANRRFLIAEGIVSKLVDVLKDFAPVEWRVGGVTCQLLWNLCESSSLSSQEADVLLQVLHTYLEDNAPFQLLDTSQWDEDIKEYVLHNWKSEFCPFASRLYKKVSSQHSQLIPLEGEELPSQ